MKNLFKNWTLFEKILIIASFFTVLITGICFKNDVLTITTSILGIFCAFFLAKGFLIAQFSGILLVVLYSILCFQNAFYGEMMVYILIMLPMYVWGIFEWKKHKSEKTNSVEVNSIKWQEWIIVSVVAMILFIAFYFILKALNTSQLIISTLSVIDNIFAVYLLARRSKYGFVSYIVNDLILIALWGIPVIQGNFLVIAMLINPIVNLINDIYGVVNWSKLQKRQ